jgi:hypothetical protein
MANRVHAFKDTDIKRALRASKDAGYTPTGFELCPHTGRIKVLFDAGQPGVVSGSGLDDWMAKHAD